MAPPKNKKPKSKLVGQGSSSKETQKWILIGVSVLVALVAVAAYGAVRLARDGLDDAANRKAWDAYEAYLKQEQQQQEQQAAESKGAQTPKTRPMPELDPNDDSESPLAARAKQRKLTDDEYQAYVKWQQDQAANGGSSGQTPQDKAIEEAEEAEERAAKQKAGIAVELPASERFGYSSDGQVYSHPKEVWESMPTDKDGKPSAWYEKTVTFWDAQEASNKGVLLGYDELHPADIRDSRELLLKTYRNFHPGVLEQNGSKMRALDVGAGVGRITKELLLHYFGTVDLVEPSQKLLDKAKEELKGKVVPGVPAGHKAGKFIRKGLQDLDIKPFTYDVIWVQWCMLYVTENDLMDVLLRLRIGLQPDGILVIKENVAEQGFVVDKKDNSVTRSRAIFEKYFQEMGLMILEHGAQKDFPEGLYEVHQWALTRAPPTTPSNQQEVDQHYAWAQQVRAQQGQQQGVTA